VAPPLDTALLRALRTHGHGDGVERGIARFSALGEHGSVWLAIAAAGALIDGGRREEFKRAGITVAAAYAANQAIKLAVRRRRPQLADLPSVVPTHSQLSYPSAHASTSFAAARALGDGLLPAPALYALAIPLALSRPYLGVHYPSDTLAGAVLGTAVAELRR
jgi:membrane-associated phospholipid phosphatase